MLPIYWMLPAKKFSFCLNVIHKQYTGSINICDFTFCCSYEKRMFDYTIYYCRSYDVDKMLKTSLFGIFRNRFFTSCVQQLMNKRYTFDKQNFYLINDTEKASGFPYTYIGGRLVVNDGETITQYLRLTDEELERSCMQGGCFDNDNHLHIVNGFVTNYKGSCLVSG